MFLGQEQQQLLIIAFILQSNQRRAAFAEMTIVSEQLNAVSLLVPD